jgi:protein phosphatase
MTTPESTTEMRLVVAAATDPGRVREHNEDCYRVEPEPALLLVADGMGGHQAGEVASRLAVETIYDCLVRSGQGQDLPPEQLLEDGLLAAHQAIRDSAGQDPARLKMGTTAVVAWLPPPGQALWVAHVGDSRAYLWRAGQLRPLTEDHTILNQVRRAGLLPADPDEWPPRTMLSQSLGASDVIAPEVSHIPIRAGDRILLCTDGLTDMLDEAEIAGHLASPEPLPAICAALIEAANAHGGKDNITVVVADVIREA